MNCNNSIDHYLKYTDVSSQKIMTQLRGIKNKQKKGNWLRTQEMTFLYGLKLSKDAILDTAHQPNNSGSKTNMVGSW